MVESDGAAVPPPPADEDLIIHCESTFSPSCSRMVFDRGDCTDAVRKSPAGVLSSPNKSPKPFSSIENDMFHLDNEFCYILLSRARRRTNSLVDLVLLFQRQRSEESSSNFATSYQSTSNIIEFDQLPPDEINKLRSIAQWMITAGYERQCFHTYNGIQQFVVGLFFSHLGIKRFDIPLLEWDISEFEIHSWICAARVCFRFILASERRLCDRIFHGLLGGDTPFVELVDKVIILLSFARVTSFGSFSPKMLFSVLDLHDALTDLLPDIATIFQSRALESISTEVADIIAKLAEVVRGILRKFENDMFNDPLRFPISECTIHQHTMYVMDYISLISDYKQTLTQLINLRPPSTNLLVDNNSDDVLSDMKFLKSANQSPLVSHLIYIILTLQFNIKKIAQICKDSSFSFLFLTNNLYYIIQKIKGSTKLNEMIGHEYLKKLTSKFEQVATSYERTTWIKVMYCLRNEDLILEGCFSSSVSKSSLKKRFKDFNAEFEKVHRTQSMWYVSDPQLRAYLRVSITQKLIPVYTSFLGRFRKHIKSRRHQKRYIKYSVEDLEKALADLFEGCPPPLLGRSTLLEEK